MLALGATSGAIFAGDLINGDFATGDFTGWSVSAIGLNGQSVAPAAEVVRLGNGWAAALTTGEAGSQAFITSLEQKFTVDPSHPRLSFDFLAPPSGPPISSSLFKDTLTVSLFDEVSSRVLFLADFDVDGLHPDPFGTAPGMVAVGPAGDAPSLYQVIVDLSPLVGSPGSPPMSMTLAIDVSNQDDGRSTTSFVTGFLFQTLAPPKVPETPTPLWILSLWLLLLSARCLRRRR